MRHPLFAICLGLILNQAAIGAAPLPSPITTSPTAFSENLLEKFADRSNPSAALAEVFEPPANWRYYRRDGGTLVAISVSEELLFTERVAGEKAMADIAQRLIRQGGDNGLITAVFVEPFSLPPTPAPPPISRQLVTPIMQPVHFRPCGCR